MHKVSCKGVPLGVGLVKGDRKYGLYSIKTITTMEFTHTFLDNIISLLQHVPSTPTD